MQQKTQFEEFGNEAESRASGPMVVTRWDGSHQPMEGEAMLRKGIITLMISVMSVSGIQAADGGNSNSLLGLFRGPSIGRTQPRPATPKTAPGGVQHAVIEDVDRQVPEVRQTSARPEQETLQPAESAPQPTPISYSQPAPTPYSAQPLPPANLPQVSPETHPQFFSGRI